MRKTATAKNGVVADAATTSSHTMLTDHYVDNGCGKANELSLMTVSLMTGTIGCSSTTRCLNNNDHPVTL